MNTQKILLPVVGLMALATIITSCKTQKTVVAPKEINCTTSPTYAADIKPIIDESCGNSCHSAKRKAHGIDLSSFEGVKDAAADKSFLGAINHEKGFDKMPRMRGKLDDATIEKITCWVRGGMQ